MNKKLISFLAAFCLVAAAVVPSFPGQAWAYATSGTDGGVCWEITGNVLTIRAAEGTNGKMRSYSYVEHAPWQDCPEMGKVEKVVVADGVTGLGTLAFYADNLHLKEMQICGSIDVIPAYFCHSVTIDSLYINEGVRSLEEGAFYGVTKTVYVAGSVASLPFAAFGKTSAAGNENVSYVSHVYGYTGSRAQDYAENYIKAVEATNSVVRMWKDGKKYALDADLDGQADADPKITFTALDGPAVFQSAKVTSSLSVSVKKAAAIKVTVPSGLATVGKYTGTEGEVKISYKSKNGKIASVNANGVVTGKKKGTTTITTTLKLQNGTKKKFTTKVTVK